jgi:hypothetical protein
MVDCSTRLLLKPNYSQRPRAFHLRDRTVLARAAAALPHPLLMWRMCPQSTHPDVGRLPKVAIISTSSQPLRSPKQGRLTRGALAQRPPHVCCRHWGLPPGWQSARRPPLPTPCPLAGRRPGPAVCSTLLSGCHCRRRSPSRRRRRPRHCRCCCCTRRGAPPRGHRRWPGGCLEPSKAPRAPRSY